MKTVLVNVRAASCEPWFFNKELHSGIEELELFFFSDPLRKRGRVHLQISIVGSKACIEEMSLNAQVGDLADDEAVPGLSYEQICLASDSILLEEDVGAAQAKSTRRTSVRVFTGYSPIEPDSVENLNLFVIALVRTLYGFDIRTRWFAVPSAEEVEESEEQYLEWWTGESDFSYFF